VGFPVFIVSVPSLVSRSRARGALVEILADACDEYGHTRARFVRPGLQGAELLAALLADSLEENARGLVGRILRDELAGEGVAEEGLAEAGGAEGAMVDR
jgi:hypothetical protein